MEPIDLTLAGRCCAVCASYDGDHYCALPRQERQLAGVILVPTAVVCLKFAPVGKGDK